jgi:hypothetical protein
VSLNANFLVYFIKMLYVHLPPCSSQINFSKQMSAMITSCYVISNSASTNSAIYRQYVTRAMQRLSLDSSEQNTNMLDHTQNIYQGQTIKMFADSSGQNTNMLDQTQNIYQGQLTCSPIHQDRTLMCWIRLKIFIKDN